MMELFSETGANASLNQKYFVMYYESMLHSVKQVDSVMDAANLLYSDSKPPTYECLSYKKDDKDVFLVSDVHIDSSSWFEVAVLIKDGDAFYQVESITKGWIKTPEQLAKYFDDAITSPAAFKSKVSLLIGNSAPSTATAYFTCGCCGNGFKGNVAEQLKFDQDNGYGICSRCQ